MVLLRTPQELATMRWALMALIGLTMSWVLIMISQAQVISLGQSEQGKLSEEVDSQII